MREALSIVFIVLILVLSVGAVISRRTNKAVGRAVSRLLTSILLPVTGNLILIVSHEKLLSTAGCYIYFIGMDFFMFAMLMFAVTYSQVRIPAKVVGPVIGVLLADVVQLALNPIFGHAFSTEKIEAYGAPYYRLVPYAGQYFHRIVDYGIFLSVLIFFFIMTIRSPRIYSERYSVIFICLLLGGLWQTFYIFSRSPLDRSMIGFAVFGVLCFYFSLYYRPMKLLDRMLANIVSKLPDSVFFFDMTGRCIWANSNAKELAGITGGEFSTANDSLKGIFGSALDLSSNGWTSHLTIGSGSNEKYYALEKFLVNDEHGNAAGSFLNVRDNTAEQLRLRQEIHNATHDRLTGLYNREYLYSRISQLIASSPDCGRYVVFVDIKNFKIVNDIFSNDFGDFTLKCIAEWLRRECSDNCIYGRLGGDTFGVLVPVDEFDPAELEDELTQFVVNDGTVEYHVLIHIGVYRITEADTDVSVMFDRAHLALSMIKDEYQTHIAYYDDKIRSQVLWDQFISAQLHDALRTRELRPFLQPIVDTSGRIVGAEALARWIHPTEGFLSPAKFIPVFEKNGMIVEVDKHMWRCACEILSRWQKEGRSLFISVNISPKDFYFIDVTAEIKSLVREFGIDPSLLRIEITETVMMNNIDDKMAILNDLRHDGFIVEMDDFGSGYSSLNMLKDMPVDVLKIDMKFLSKSSDEKKARTIIQNILKLSEDLGIASLTEGVETAEQFGMLRGMSCRLFQGYHFSKPVSVSDFEGLLS
ncbi:MAG: EAL domain-containing protein [Ruminococcus sp.]|nr:EAL domain-containing protein [Ruminococcus sp.]